MKIPSQLYQFKNHPTLLLVTGDYEAKFFVAHNGVIFEREDLQFSMREDAKEKQAYAHTNPSPEKQGAMSHYGAYREDLERKFYEKIGETAEDVVYGDKVEEIYILSPSRRISGIKNKLRKMKLKIRGSCAGEYTKNHPTEIINIFEEEFVPKAPDVVRSEEERKILKKPRIRKR